MDNNFIVKIETEFGLATAFLYLPTGHSEIAYAITARHNFTDKENDIVNAKNVKLHFFNHASAIYEVTTDDKIIFGSNFKTEDFAVLAFRKTGTPLKDFTQATLLSTLHGKEKKLFVKGVPKLVHNKALRSLYKVKFLPDKDFAHQLQFEVSDPISGHYNSDDLVEGYSGSPIFFESKSKPYAVGIFLEYEAHTKRILGIDLGPINQKLKESNLPGLTFDLVEADEEVLIDIKTIYGNTQRVLGRIQSKIGEITLPRTDVVKVVKEGILSNPFTLVIGKAGIGKSAIAKKALLELHEDFEIIVLQGEQLDKTSISEIFSESNLNIQGSFHELLNSPGLKPQKILLLDSIEKLLETSNADTIIDFFNVLHERRDVKIVLTCRSYAVEQLKIRFLQHFPVFEPYDIPVLSEKELEQICSAYPVITPLLFKPSLKEILRIPFNLDKATHIDNNGLSSIPNSESDFKRLIWEYVIENKGKELDPEIRYKRAYIFQRLALERATKMVPYVSVGPGQELILHKLLQDGLIEVNPVLSDFYSVSHDIYEDWALTRIIEAQYMEKILAEGSAKGFIQGIGYAPAIRRAFRIWISEKMQNVDYNIQKMIQEVLDDETIQHYWKDEIIIAIMQSEYSESFLTAFNELLFKNNFSLFNRFLLLLNVACQVPDFRYLSFLEESERSTIYYSGFLKPYGPGWANMMGFILSHFNKVSVQLSKILPLILQWGKGLDIARTETTESKTVGLVIIKYLQLYEKLYENDEPLEGKNYLSDLIPLLFRLTPALKNEIKALIEKAVAFDKRKGRHYQQRILWQEVTKNVLSWSSSKELCKELPDLVLGVAEKEWFYYPPKNEEIDELHKNSPFKSLPLSVDKDELFGVKDDYHRDYSPSSSYQTPISHLLAYATEKTLHFIARLFNHSVEVFKDSDFLLKESQIFEVDSRHEVHYQLMNGTVVKQYGSLALWTMYRGTYVVTPSLLQSTLMCLEAYLLELAKFVESDKESKYPILKERLDLAFDILLTESNSVSTTAVLVSVVLAHENFLADKILPLLRVKEFYKWDSYRKFYDPKASVLFRNIPNGNIIQKERMASKDLPHRKKDLESLVLKLSFGKYSSEILGILDTFYSENSVDEHWKFALNKMDRRKLEIVEEVENGFLLKPKIDEELKPLVEEAITSTNELSAVSEVNNWSLKKLEGEVVAGDDFEQWRRYFEVMSRANFGLKNVRLFSNPTALAAVGVRHYYDRLSKSEKEWCINKVFSVIDYELSKSSKPYDFDVEAPFSAFESEPGFVSLVELINKLSGAQLLKAKELLFLCFILVNEKPDKETFIKRISENLWINNSNFGKACVAGLVEYSKIAELRFKVLRAYEAFNYSMPKEAVQPEDVTPWGRILHLFQKLFSKVRNKENEVIHPDFQIDQLSAIKSEFENRFEEIITAVKDDTIQLNFTNLPSSDSAPQYLLDALFIIPANTPLIELQSYYSKMLKYVFDNLNQESRFGNDRIHHAQLYHFETQFAAFLLSQPKDVSLAAFKEMVDWVFEKETGYDREKTELVEQCVESLLSQTIGNDSYLPNFWNLWEYLSVRILGTGNKLFVKMVLLDYQYWPANPVWNGVKGKKQFFIPLIKQVGSLESTARLLGGVGYDELLPDGIIEVGGFLVRQPILYKREVFYLDKLIMKIFYDKEKRNIVRNNSALRNVFILILDTLINQNSASAFLIREDFISVRA